ncbi:hypothetical protein PMAYCL1PPCAC_16424, partial [Pristionchus mayeri]
KQFVGSSMMLPAPIATLTNTNGSLANIAFVVSRTGSWSGSLPVGATTIFLSNGFLELGESYAMETENDNVFSRSYDFGKETQIFFNPAVGNYYPDSGDRVILSCIKANGQTVVYDCGDLAGSVKGDTCKSVALKVTKGTRTATGTRFEVVVQS